MAVQTDSSMSFGELILDCAERWGHADETGTLPGIPTDVAVLDKVKRKINDGLRAFLAANPRWSFAEQRIRITWFPDGDGPNNIDGDAGRYRLPQFIGSQPLSDWTLVGDNVPDAEVMTFDYDMVRRALAKSTATGMPERAGVGPITTDDGVGGQPKAWEVLFYPRPSSAYTAEAYFRVTSQRLVDLSDRHIAGREHDETIIAFCDHQWYKDDAEDPEVVARYLALRGEMIPGTKKATGALGRSIELDKQMSPRRHGKVVDPSTGQTRVNRWTGLGRITIDGVAQ